MPAATVRDLARQLVGQIRTGLEDRDRHRQPVKAHRVLGRNTDGTIRLLALDGECEIRGGITPGYEGQVIVGPISPTFSHRGAAGVGRLSGLVTRGLVWVESLDPAVYSPGQSYTVTVTGRGFSADFVRDFLTDDSSGFVSPDITVTEQRLISDTELELDIDVAADAALVGSAALSYSGAGAPGTAGSETLLSKRKLGAYSIVESGVVPMFYAFFDASGSILASIYDSGGAWISDRNTLARDFPSAASCVCIVSDAGGKVGVGSLVWQDGATLRVWDVEGDAEHVYDPATDGLNLDALTGVVFWNGWLYWWEQESSDAGNNHTSTWYLRKGRADFTALSTVGSVSFQIFETEFSVDWTYTSQNLSLNATACLVTADWLDNLNFEVSGTAIVRQPLNGSAGSYEDEAINADGFLGQPDSAGASVGLVGTTLGEMDDDIAAEPVERWPSSGNWDVDFETNAALSADGITAMVYGEHGDDGWIAVIAPAAATSGEPTQRLAISDHPTEAAPPGLLFLLE